MIPFQFSFPSSHSSLSHVSPSNAFFVLLLSGACRHSTAASSSPRPAQSQPSPVLPKSRTQGQACTTTAPSKLGLEFRWGQKRAPHSADSDSWTLKSNAVISRSARSYKSKGFNADRACQREQEMTAASHCPCSAPSFPWLSFFCSSSCSSSCSSWAAACRCWAWRTLAERLLLCRAAAGATPETWQQIPRKQTPSLGNWRGW